MNDIHRESLNKVLESVHELILATYKQGRIDQVAIDQVAIDQAKDATAKATFVRGYKKGHKHGKSQGYKEGKIDGHKEESAEQAAEPGPEPVFARAYGEPWSPEDQAEPEPEHATSQEADYGLNEPASFAYLAGHTTGAEYRVERGSRGRSLRKHITELRPLVDSEALADFLRRAADEVWLEAADCFLADLMNCFSRHLPLTSHVRSWLIRKASAANVLSDKLGIYRWKGGSPLTD